MLITKFMRRRFVGQFPKNECLGGVGLRNTGFPPNVGFEVACWGVFGHFGGVFESPDIDNGDEKCSSGRVDEQLEGGL
jgi:hypothetical protein